MTATTTATAAGATAGPSADLAYPATHTLATTVRALTRARARQALAQWLWAGLFLGTVSACITVLVIRVGGVPFSPTIAALAVTGLVIGAVGLVALGRAPDDLQVAIRADLELKLQQRLSTAWEFARAGLDPVLTERLAAQATRARLPARPATLYPVRVNTWGKLVPIAVAALLFVSIVDINVGFPWTRNAAGAAADTLVVAEGERLREFALNMRERAERAALPRSTEQAQAMRDIAQRMRSGALTRESSLAHLQQLDRDLDGARRAALAGSAEVDAGPLDIETLQDSPDAGSESLAGALQDLLHGRAVPEDMRLSDAQTRALRRAGVSAEDLEEALKKLSSGNRDELRRILESLEDEDRRLREAEELDRARSEVWRARESLGESGAYGPGEEPGRQGSAGLASGRPDGVLGEFSGDMEDESMGGAPSGAGSGKSLQSGGDTMPAASVPDSQRAGPVLKPESQIREGTVFSSHAMVQPRAGAPAAAALEMDARYTAQVEAVLSKEHYPLHRKEYVRRYFLNLSEGTPVQGQQEGLPERNRGSE